MTAAACVGVSYWRNSIPESLVYYPLDSTDWIVPSFENFRATPSDSSCTHDRNRLAAAVHEIIILGAEVIALRLVFPMGSVYTNHTNTTTTLQ